MFILYGSLPIGVGKGATESLRNRRQLSSNEQSRLGKTKFAMSGHMMMVDDRLDENGPWWELLRTDGGSMGRDVDWGDRVLG